MDYFNIDSVFELIDKSKRKIIDEMEAITFENDKLSKEADKLLQILEYSPKKRQLEREIIKSLPIIKLKPPEIEHKKTKNKNTRHSKLPSTPNIDSYITPNKELNQENQEIVKDILNSIIDNSVEKSENKEKKEEQKSEKSEEDEDDDDDYFEKMMAQREKQMEEREKKMAKENEEDEELGIRRHKPTKSQDLVQMEKSKDNRQISYTSRLSKAMNLLTKVKVYIFNTETNFDINISPNDTVKSVKNTIINILINKKYDLTYTTENAFDIRLIEDDSTKPNMDYPPLENSSLMLLVKPKAIAFLENPKYDPSQDYSSEKILGNVKTKNRSSSSNNEKNNQNENEYNSKNNEDESNLTKMNIKVYYKANGINSSKIISLSSDDNLKGILKIFFNQDLLQYKNFDFYYFVEYKSAQELDNAINLETNIKYLPSYELHLCYKNFPDLPEAMNAYNKGMMLNSGEDDEKKVSKNEKDDEGNSSGRDFFFNEISAGLYQEFEVVKINKFKSKQERILGIDMYNLYNNMPKKKPTGIMNLIFKETKKPRRKMKNVKECAIIGDKSFYIDIKDEVSDEVKRGCYEVKNNLIRDEIVAKINFLIKLNQENAN